MRKTERRLVDRRRPIPRRDPVGDWINRNKSILAVGAVIIASLYLVYQVYDLFTLLHK